MGKHSSAVTKSNNNRRPVYLTAVGLLVLSLGAVFVVRSFGSESGADGFLGGKSCDDPTQIRLSTTPELQPQLESAAKSLANKDNNDGPCLQFTISGAPSAKVAQEVKQGNDNGPDLWVPDSSLWIAQADDGQTVPADRRAVGRKLTPRAGRPERELREHVVMAQLVRPTERAGAARPADPVIRHPGTAVDRVGAGEDQRDGSADHAAS